MRLFGQDWSQPKGHQRGTHRSCSPQETLARLRPLARPLGITRLANLTGLDVIGMPVWAALRPNARGLSSAQGKGLDADCAKVSALMEAIECWHAEHIKLPLRCETARMLARHEAVAALAGLAGFVAPEQLFDSAQNWLQADDLLSGASCWLPYDAVSTNYAAPAHSGLLQSSNGLAGGNHVLEATSHALTELIERDAVAIGDAAMRSADAPIRIRPETVDDPHCRQVLALLERADVRVALFDLRSDLGIPVCGATIVDGPGQRAWRTLPAFSGYGCHLSPQIALLRALTEAVQSRLTHISGTRDDISPGDYRRGGNPDELDTLCARLDAQAAAVDFATLPDLATESFEGDVSLLLERLRGAGLEQVLVADLRRPELGVAVVRAVVPGLAAPTSMLRTQGLRQQRRSNAQPWHAKVSTATREAA
ncbi:YcaO-like family protein [Paucibacter sp. DJ1R-11]|uniref:YcaO-like family protein n=1 Tax=Paucibacter sp. DJ1R-11 TaxID=2893556 RepID=UPI0021E43780|nr:YcaO-like family protein [Paucibacter sp. DJ1R-11]MCV2365758.1 YcaO-like family protein [Paucibacter sp. DJ1R-11]